MSKTNVKAGTTQVAASVAAEQAKQEAQANAAAAAAAQEQSSAPNQEVSGVNDASTDKPATDAGADKVAEQEAAAAAAAAESLIVTPTAPAAPVAPVATLNIPLTPQAPAPVAPPKVFVAEAAKPVVANASSAEQLANILKSVPAANQIDINRIQTYLDRMAPKRPIDSKAGSVEQVALYRAVQNIINRQEEFFTPLFSAVLFLFKTYGRDGALSDRYRMRFMDNIALPVGDRKAFANITQMLHILADPKSRNLAMKQVSMERALENGLTAEGRDRVLNYFGA